MGQLCSNCSVGQRAYCMEVGRCDCIKFVVPVESSNRKPKSKEKPTQGSNLAILSSKHDIDNNFKMVHDY